MSISGNIPGARWYKCDLHLHTPGSLCFLDQNVSAKEWVERAIEQGLHCVAVTDHNTGAWVDQIQAAAEGTSLVVFPGVEITCDASKIHLLILFDVNKKTADVRDFLVRADIKADDFGKQDASTVKSIFEIATLAQRDGAMVIPAHIDEYNGLGSVSIANIEKFFTEGFISAVQVVHKAFYEGTFHRDEVKAHLNEYYNFPKIAIDDTTVTSWERPVKSAKSAHLPILTFSDNPHEDKSPKHGLKGIGTRYTWIKMDEVPTLEGLRQAFLLPDHRVKNDFDAPTDPYNLPEIWIKSISVFNTSLTAADRPLHLEFNPQLNTIIGGRGSGKSSILRFIRGVFNRTKDIASLEEIFREHANFYKKEEGRPKLGVFSASSKIEVEIYRNGDLYKVSASEIESSETQRVDIFRQVRGEWELVSDTGFIDFFQFEQYSQKQIYEIAQQPNALRERIDSAADGVEKLKAKKAFLKISYLEKSIAVRRANQQLAAKGKLETNIKDLNSRIRSLQESGINELIVSRELRAKEDGFLEKMFDALKRKEHLILNTIESLKLDELDVNIFDDKYKPEIEQIVNRISSAYKEITQGLTKIKEQIENVRIQAEKEIIETKWMKDVVQDKEALEKKKEELGGDIGESLISFERLYNEREKLGKELDNLETILAGRDQDQQEQVRLKREFIETSKEITESRRNFLNKLLNNGDIKVIVKPFRDKADFELQLRRIIQRENESFQDDIDKLSEICFKGNVENKLEEVKQIFRNIRGEVDIDKVVSGYFINLVKTLNDEQLDELELLLPEDELEIQYKPQESSAFKSLSTASAGQKTTAILTYVLSHGRTPLILDQPEDDLDNRLVYDLVVSRLKEAKEGRQIIIVTHNANIPVNGDAEFIISMDSESKFLKVLYSGTVEKLQIKKEICNVMEGGEKAFELRSKRYLKIP